jgi:repressor LexA
MITERQQEILDFIREQQDLRGMTPTVAEIQERFGFASPNAVTSHLQALERKGTLLREPNKARGLVLADSYRGRAMVEIPIYGTIPAGLPTDERQEPDGCIGGRGNTAAAKRGARLCTEGAGRLHDRRRHSLWRCRSAGIPGAAQRGGRCRAG